jgi:hypothetical protein
MISSSFPEILRVKTIFETMKTLIITLFIAVASCLAGCSSSLETQTTLEQLKSNAYYPSEIFSQDYLNIYGRWKLFAVSWGFTGSGHELNFDILEVKKYGIYGIFNNEDVLEFGKIVTVAVPNEDRLRIFFEKDEKSGVYMGDNEKFIFFSGKDTLHLNSPCCDRYNYHFARLK